MTIKTGFLLVLFIGAAFLFIYIQNYSREYHSTQEGPKLSMDNFSTPRFPAPDFTLTDLENNEITLSDYKGSVVLIMFWTTW